MASVTSIGDGEGPISNGVRGEKVEQNLEGFRRITVVRETLFVRTFFRTEPPATRVLTFAFDRDASSDELVRAVRIQQCTS